MPTPPFPRDTLPGSFTFLPGSYRTDTPAWLPHLPFAYDLVAWLRPALVVELGTHLGNSYFTMCQSARDHRVGAACYAVDTWQGDEHSEYYAGDVFDHVTKHNDINYRDFSYLLRMTFDEALTHFSDNSIELLHIDGFHTYEAVRHDFETWLPKVREGGIVLLHDILVRKEDFGVWKFWEELRQKHPAFSFYQGYGLGVLTKGPSLDRLPETVRRLFAADPEEADFVRSYYARCAERLAGIFYPCEYERRLQEREAEHKQRENKLLTELTEVQRIPALEEQARQGARQTYDVRRMKHSLSWKLTAPLREVNRAWGKLRRAVHCPLVSEEFVYNIDVPGDWKLAPQIGRIEGWLYSSLGITINGVRARAAGKIWLGHGHISRPDVALHHILAGPSSGFSIPYRLPKSGKFKISLEALLPDGQWVVFARNEVRMPPDKKGAYALWIKADAHCNPPLPPPSHGPLFSVLMPVYNTPDPWLRRALDSVRNQTYTHWELCVADDASTDPQVRAVLSDYAARDARIKVTYRKKNGHISAASNSALELATGEFTALLDHDDELAPHALAAVAQALSTHPAAELIYSDEDKIDETGRRFEPNFKPDWLPDLFLGQNFVCHLTAYRTALLRAVGGFRAGFEGSQDWDLALRVSERIHPENIVHIPKVLYHWRAIPDSTAKSLKEKDYHLAAATRALREYLERNHIVADLMPVAGGHWRLRYPLPAAPPRVAIIIPTRNGVSLLRISVESLLTRTTYPNFEIVIVDNGSDDPSSLSYLNELRQRGVKVLCDDRPFNYSALNNHAAKLIGGEVLAFLNNDIEVITPGWLDEMVSQALRPGIGAVGAMLYYPDDRVQHAGVILGLGGVAGHAMKNYRRGEQGYINRLRLVQNYSAVTGACLVVRRQIFEQVGGFNESDLAIAFNDVDFCLRVRAAGYRNLWTPFAELYHHESASRGPEDTPEKQARFGREIAYMRKKWGSDLDHDPAYNPNLTHNHENFNLSWPPRPHTA